MTYEELQQLLLVYLGLENLPRKTIEWPLQVPELLNSAAKEMFLRKDCDSDLAEVVRGQLRHLKTHRQLDLKKEQEND
jgi:hypothetical protein